MANLKKLVLRKITDAHGNPIRPSIKVQVPLDGSMPKRILTVEQQAAYEKILRASAPAGWLNPYTQKEDNEWMKHNSSICIANIQGESKVFDLDNPIDHIQYLILIEKGIAAAAADRNKNALYAIIDVNQTKEVAKTDWVLYYEVMTGFGAMTTTWEKVGFIITAGMHPERVPSSPTREELHALLNTLLTYNNQLDGEKIAEVADILKTNAAELEAHILLNAALHFGIIVDAGTGARNRYSVEGMSFQNLTALRKFLEAGILEKKAVTENIKLALAGK